MSETITISNTQKAVIFVNWFLKLCGIALLAMIANFYFGNGFTPFQTLQAARIEQNIYELAEGLASTQDKTDSLVMRIEKRK